jgi:hypothetical protein
LNQDHQETTMTQLQIVQRLVALEEKVAQLEAHLPTAPRTPPEKGDELLPGVEYPTVLTPPPFPRRRMRGRVRSIRRGQQDLGLSATEWESLSSEPTDE